VAYGFPCYVVFMPFEPNVIWINIIYPHNIRKTICLDFTQEENGYYGLG